MRGTRRRPASPLWAKLTLALGILTVIGSGGSLVGGKILLSHVSNTIQQQNLLGAESAGANVAKGPLNVLMVGLDTRVADPALGSRSDSIVIAHIPASHDRAYLVSIPRDTSVNIPAFAKSGYRGGSDKINAAFEFGSMNGGGTAGGMQLLAMTLKQVTGLSFNAAVTVNFDGFKDVVAAMGGVNMCIDEKVTSLHIGFVNGTNTHTAPFKILDGGLRWTPIPGTHPMVYEPGCRHLSSWQALDYVRQRDMLANGDGDYGRQRHQQQFIKALLKEGFDKGMSNPFTLNTFLEKVSKAFVFDGGGASITDWIFTMKGINPSSIVMIKTNGGTYNSVTVNGQSREELSPTSKALLAAVRADNVDSFIAANPSWVSSG
jgi:polyisoprenyl-teichoic acid--peptidoglycan teichoic acid transferase